MTKALFVLWGLSIATCAVAGIVWVVYFFQFVRQPSWISDEAFRLQGVHLGAWLVMVVAIAAAWLIRSAIVSRT